MIRHSLALAGAVALTLAAVAACGRQEETPAEAPPAAAVEAPAPAAVPAAAPTATPTTAAEFVPMAAMANMFEIETSKLAQQKGQSAAVKDVAKMIVADHTKLGANMEAAVKKAGMTVTMPTALTGDMATRLADLQAATPADFDAKYLEAQRDAHEKAIAAFQTFSDAGDNADIKAVATGALPKLKAHLDAVNKAIAAGAGAATTAPAAAAAAPAKK